MLIDINVPRGGGDSTEVLKTEKSARELGPFPLGNNEQYAGHYFLCGRVLKRWQAFAGVNLLEEQKPMENA